jgi:GntR family transcriptional regulator
MLIRLDKNSDVPLYHQLQEQLRDAILSGDLRPGEPIPNEEELAARLSVSRFTVRQAMGELVRQGLVVRTRGRGSFVQQTKETMSSPPGKLLSFSEMFPGQGVTTRILRQEKMVAAGGAVRELGLVTGQNVVVVERLRMTNGVPVSLETSHYPFDRFPALATRDLNGQSVYKILDEEYDSLPQQAVEVVEVTVATSYEASLLGISTGVPVYLGRRTSYDASGKPVEYTKSVYRADRYRFVTHLSREDIVR